MNPQPQHQEPMYLISEKLLTQIITCSKRTEEMGCSGCPYAGNGVNCAVCSWEEEIRSHPAPSPSERATIDMVYGYEAGFEDGKRDEREKVLKKLRDSFEEFRCNNSWMDSNSDIHEPMFECENIQKILNDVEESLRREVRR